MEHNKIIDELKLSITDEPTLSNTIDESKLSNIINKDKSDTIIDESKLSDIINKDVSDIIIDESKQNNIINKDVSDTIKEESKQNNKNILFIDLETTLTYNKDKIDNDKRRKYSGSRIIQIGYILNDESGEILINPNCRITTTHIHGITDKMAKKGITIKEALKIISEKILIADTFVSHNISFDHTILINELDRWEYQEASNKMANMKTICTMKLSRQKFGIGKLGDIYAKIFNKNIINQHTALADTIACRDIYNYMV